MIEYLKKLFKTWFLYLGLLPAVYDYTSAYLPWDILKLQSIYLYPISLLAFLFASYSVWEDEKKAKDDLIKTMANPVKYNVIGELTPINFEVEKQLKRIDDNTFKAQEEINSANLEIKQLSSNDKYMQYAIALTASNDLYDTYKYKLLKYIDELTNYIEKSEEYKTQYQERVNVLSDRYFIVFKIENIGSKSDSQINIEIKTQQNNFIDAKNMYDLVFRNIPTLPLKPESPMQKVAKNFDFMKSINSQPNPDLFHPNRLKVQFDDKNALVIIKEMNVGKIEDTSKEKMFIELLDESDFQITIHSKESSAVIEKILEVKVKNTAKKLMEHI